MNGTPVLTKASWSATRRRTPERPPPHNHSMPKGELQRRLCSSDPECNPRGLRKPAGQLSRAFSRPLSRGHVFQPSSSTRGPTCPVTCAGDPCPSRPTVGFSPEPVYSVGQPCRGLCPENALRGPPPTLSPLHSGRVEDTVCSQTPRPDWLPQWHKVSVKKATSLERQAHPLFRNGM